MLDTGQVDKPTPELVGEFFSTVSRGESLDYLSQYPATQVAQLIESVDVPNRFAIIEAVGAQNYWQVLNYLQFDTAKHTHLSLPQAFVEQCLTHLSESDVVTFTDLLPSDYVDEFLLTQSSTTAARIQQVLAFDDSQVGRYAEPSFLVANTKNSVGRIRKEIAKRVDSPVKLIIVTDANAIVGVVYPDALVTPDNDTKLKALMVEAPQLEASQDIYQVSKLLGVDSHSHWFPVVNEGKVVGVLSVTTLVTVMRELSMQAVVHENVKSEEDLFTPLSVVTRLRALWLVINLVTAFAASAIIGVFDSVVEQVVALAILMPVVASMGGIAGSQTLAVSLRGIALNHLHQSNLKLLVNKELKVAAINGSVMGAAIGLIVYLVFGSVPLGVIIFCAIAINSLAAAASGTLIPFTLQKLKIDPAVAGSVILTTVTDVVGFLVFLGLGAIFLV